MSYQFFSDTDIAQASAAEQTNNLIATSADNEHLRHLDHSMNHNDNGLGGFHPHSPEEEFVDKA